MRSEEPKRLFQSSGKQHLHLTYCSLLVTLYLLPNTSYQLPSSPVGIPLLTKDLRDIVLSKEDSIESGNDGRVMPSLDLFYLTLNQVGDGALKPCPLFPCFVFQPKLSSKINLDKPLFCGYIYNMTDRTRETNSMVHVRFTEPERRKMKAICALEGISMQEYIRQIVIEDIKKKGRKRI